MLLHQIRPNYNTIAEAERHAHIAAYRAKRFKELDSPIPDKKTRKKKTLEPKTPKAKLSKEEKALLKQLGISLKALKTLE
jgi:hypothetical protein